MLCGLELHHRAAPGLARPGGGAGRRGHHGQSFLHRDGQRGPLLRRHSGIRRHRPAHLQHGSLAARAAITPRTRAIMPVHQMGLPCDMPAILKSRISTVCRWSKTPPAPSAARSGLESGRSSRQAARNGRLFLVPSPQGDHHGRRRDAHYLGRRVGPDVPTAPPARHERAGYDRHAARTVIFEEYPEVGFNYRMTDIQAAVGQVRQLSRLSGIMDRRVSLGTWYTQALSTIIGLEPPFVPDYARPNYQSYPVRVTPEFPLSRDKLMQDMLDHGISTRRGIMNSHQEKAYIGLPRGKLPHSETARDSVILLPLFSELSHDDVRWVADCLRSAAQRERI